MIKLVPGSLREGSLALGSPEWKTALSVTLPAASQGIITGILLGIARASGETAPLLFTALGNDNYDIGRIIQAGVANHQNVLTILGKISHPARRFTPFDACGNMPNNPIPNALTNPGRQHWC